MKNWKLEIGNWKLKDFVKSLFRHPLFSGSALMMGGNMLANVVNYFYHLVMGRVLGPTSYGELVSLYSILYMVSIIPISSSFAIVKKIAEEKTVSKQVATYVGIKKLMGTVALTTFVVIVIFSPLLANFLKIENLLSVSLISAMAYFSLLTLVNQATMQAQLKFIGVVGPTIFSSIGKFAFGYILIFFGWGLLGAMWGVVLASFFTYLLSKKLIGDFAKKVSSGEFAVKPFLKSVLPVLVQAVSFTSIFTIDLILVKHFLPPFEAGLYAALSTLGKIIFFAVSPITSVMFPVISKKKAAGEGIKNIFLFSVLMTIGISTFIVLIYYLFPELVIGYLYGNKYLSAKMDLVWMGLFISFYTVSYLLVSFFISISKYWVVLLPFVAAVAQIVLIWFYHSSILGIIQISLQISVALFLFLILYLGYNFFPNYVKEKK